MLNIGIDTLWLCNTIIIYVLRKLGDQWSVEPDVVEDIEAFTCVMYGQAREKSVNNVRSIMLKKMRGWHAYHQIQGGSVPAPTLQRQPGPTYQPCQPPSGHLQESSQTDILVSQAPWSWPRLGKDWRGYPGTSVVLWPYPSHFTHWLAGENSRGDGWRWWRRRGARDWLWRPAEWWIDILIFYIFTFSISVYSNDTHMSLFVRFVSINKILI